MYSHCDCYVFVSNAIDGDISVFHLDGASGHLRSVGRTQAAPAVMPMAISTEQDTLYVATRGARPTWNAYSIDATSGHLMLRRTVEIASRHAYLVPDKSERLMLGASYGENLLSVYELDGDGTPLQTFSNIEHAHSVLVSPDGRYAYVASLGSDRIFSFEIDHGADKPLTLVDSVPTRGGFGPRHMRFSPHGDVLYVLGEFSATIAVYLRDTLTGRIAALQESEPPRCLFDLKEGHVRPSLNDPDQSDPAKLGLQIWAADVHVRPDGRFVFASERTTSRLLFWAVARDGRSLRYAGFADTEAQPRGFAIDPSGAFLVACGEKSSHVSVYRIDDASGMLSHIGRFEGGTGASWVAIVARAPSRTA
jgi:6-phosphogluconolactonase